MDNIDKAVQQLMAEVAATLDAEKELRRIKRITKEALAAAAIVDPQQLSAEKRSEWESNIGRLLLTQIATSQAFQAVLGGWVAQRGAPLEPQEAAIKLKTLMFP